jgi:hypothetical protein
MNQRATIVPIDVDEGVQDQEHPAFAAAFRQRNPSSLRLPCGWTDMRDDPKLVNLELGNREIDPTKGYSWVLQTKVQWTQMFRIYIDASKGRQKRPMILAHEQCHIKINRQARENYMARLERVLEGEMPHEKRPILTSGLGWKGDAAGQINSLIGDFIAKYLEQYQKDKERNRQHVHLDDTSHCDDNPTSQPC